jgi:hypothetical protein
MSGAASNLMEKDERAPVLMPQSRTKNFGRKYVLVYNFFTPASLLQF